MPKVDFYSQDVSFKIPKPGKARTWIQEVIGRERKMLVRLNFIFCSDNYLLLLNQQYLKHKTLTDIITFDHSEKKGEIEGDVFISIERVAENAGSFQTTLDEEIHRVLVHGALHLIGYNDKTIRERARMRRKEDTYLSLRNQL